LPQVRGIPSEPAGADIQITGWKDCILGAAICAAPGWVPWKVHSAALVRPAGRARHG